MRKRYGKTYCSVYKDKKEHLKYKTMKGDLVRSKSERFIADTLFSLGIPGKEKQKTHETAQSMYQFREFVCSNSRC